MYTQILYNNTYSICRNRFSRFFSFRCHSLVSFPILLLKSVACAKCHVGYLADTKSSRAIDIVSNVFLIIAKERKRLNETPSHLSIPKKSKTMVLCTHIHGYVTVTRLQFISAFQKPLSVTSHFACASTFWHFSRFYLLLFLIFRSVVSLSSTSNAFVQDENSMSSACMLSRLLWQLTQIYTQTTLNRCLCVVKVQFSSFYFRYTPIRIQKTASMIRRSFLPLSFLVVAATVSF